MSTRVDPYRVSFTVHLSLDLPLFEEQRRALRAWLDEHPHGIRTGAFLGIEALLDHISDCALNAKQEEYEHAEC